MRYRILNVQRSFADPILTVTGELWKLDPILGPLQVDAVTVVMDARVNDRRTVWQAVIGTFRDAAARECAVSEGARQTEQALEGAEFDI